MILLINFTYFRFDKKNIKHLNAYYKLEYLIYILIKKNQLLIIFMIVRKFLIEIKINIKIITNLFLKFTLINKIFVVHMKLIL